jgi:hypothetical protein
MARRRGKVDILIERVIVLEGGTEGILTDAGSGFSGSVSRALSIMQISERRSARLF